MIVDTIVCKLYETNFVVGPKSSIISRLLYHIEFFEYSLFIYTKRLKLCHTINLVT